MQKEIVRLENIHLTLKGGAGEVHALRNVCLSAQEGEKLAVVGPSGSGKTSLLMVAAGLERPTQGRATVCGLELESASPARIAAWRGRNVGVVFQAFHLLPTLTALENVSVPLELSGRKNAAATARDALARMGLEERMKHFPSELSGGEQQRVAIARAFAARPGLLLADEPTGNLDRETGASVMESLFSLGAEYGATLILVTHDPQLAARCDRTVRLESGAVV